MNIGKTLKFFRKNLNFMQKELVSEYMESSSISRIEKGLQSIKADALIEALNKMSLTTEEFFAKCLADTTQERWRELFYKCAENSKDHETKLQLVSYYKKIKDEDKSLLETVNFFNIKIYFSRHWEEIEPITEEELDNVFHYLKTKKYYQQYDYMMINNLILLMKDNQQEYLISRVIPIQDEALRNEEIKTNARRTILNLVTSKIYRKDYVGAKNYLQKAEMLEGSKRDYRFALNVEYLKNLLGYLITGEAFYMKNIHTYINLLEFIDDKQMLNVIKEEVRILTYKNKNTLEMGASDFPIGLY